MMRLRSNLFAFFVVVILIGSPASSQSKDEPKKSVETTETQTMRFVARGEVDFKAPHGQVSVEGWDRPEVLITTTKSLRTDGTPADRERKSATLAKLKIAATLESQDRLVITSRAPFAFHGRIQAIYEIKVPRQTALYIDFGAGKVSVKNVLGDIQIAAHFGEISVALPEGEHAINAKAKIGDVSSDFPLKRRSLLVGATVTTNREPEISLRVGVGHIIISKVAFPKTGASSPVPENGSPANNKSPGPQ